MQKQGRTDIARSKADEAIQFFFAALDCFAEPVIGRRLAPTRWLDMTNAVGWLPGSPQHARKALAGSTTISGCRVSDTAGDIRITRACAPNSTAAR
jgi:hypothetical protein